MTEGANPAILLELVKCKCLSPWHVPRHATCSVCRGTDRGLELLNDGPVTIIIDTKNKS